MTALEAWVDATIEVGDARNEVEAVRKAAVLAQGSPIGGFMASAVADAEKRLFDAENNRKIAFEAVIRRGMP
jgi:hypothetical protein